MATGNAFKMSLQELRDLMTFRGIEGVNKVRTLIKKKIKFSSDIRKFRMEQLQSHMTNCLIIYGEMFAHFPIYEEALPHI
jgi:hypothetical protein